MVTFGPPVSVDTEVEGDVHIALGEADAIGVVFAMTEFEFSENAQVATLHVGAHFPPPPVARYQPVATFAPDGEGSLNLRSGVLESSVAPLTFQKRKSYVTPSEPR